MSEMREYQQKLLQSKSKIVMCDWSRGKGKTYSIANNIVKKIEDTEEILKILIVSKEYRNTSILMHDCLESIIGDKFIVNGRGFEKVTISNKRELMNSLGKLGEIAGETLVDITFTSSIQNSRGGKYDYVYCDEYLPSSDELNIFCNSHAKQIYILGTFGVDYISDKEAEIPNECEWIDKEIKKLMKEFSSIDNAENTTKRREVILNMIMKLESMKPRSLYTTILTDDCGRKY